MDYVAIARHAILDLGSEDYYHLADAAAYLPALPKEQRLAAARDAMLQLVAEGLVEIAFGRLATNEVSPVPMARVAAVLHSRDAWNPEADVDNQSYVFTNTDRGNAMYFDSPSQDS